MTRSTRVFLVDDHEIVRSGIAGLIDAEPGLEVVGESATARGTLARIKATLPDVAVLDVHLPDGNGIELCRRIRSAHPEIHCLILTAYDDDAASIAAVVAGASGYVLKNIRGRHLIESILRVSQGENLVTRDLAQRVHSSLTKQAQAAAQEKSTRVPWVDLTLRENQVLALITEGLTNRQIGHRLGLKEKTVKNYVSGLLAKLGMDRRTQVAVYGATMSVGDSEG
ncbi:LuxR family transcriptional regulator [Nesterenkonia sp. AN1]|uniref:LuxR family two component transcriptional regulator n=1 Tax=Nesterenkonia aurantiaca TaxID=1436010 RepID=A0A4R7G610_9MICC|nr:MULTISPECIES: response regulator transcription factor [Nesterenkonia]EXF23995.1 LuxR family transcriptional regulator [Nesterenkonia sp. AN1]TDS86923.1 LuxR family two component transcriptional regulator [Nesterenkonia aurantiaca]